MLKDIIKPRVAEKEKSQLSKTFNLFEYIQNIIEEPEEEPYEAPLTMSKRFSSPLKSKKSINMYMQSY